MKNPNKYIRQLLFEKIEINTIESPEQNEIHIPIALEPKRENCFIVEFPEDFEIESFIVTKISKPTMKIYNNRWKWGKIEINLLDTVSPSTSKNIYELAQWCTNKNKKEFDDEIFNFSIFALDQVGVKVERWVIYVKNIEFDFGTFDYGSNNISQIKLKIEPKNCILANID